MSQKLLGIIFLECATCSNWLFKIIHMKNCIDMSTMIIISSKEINGLKKLFSTTYSQTTLLFLQQMALPGFMPTILFQGVIRTHVGVAPNWDLWWTFYQLSYSTIKKNFSHDASAKNTISQHTLPWRPKYLTIKNWQYFSSVPLKIWPHFFSLQSALDGTL